eukprot:362860-Chlamydomonas_euryale.AAC.9
MPQNCSHVTCSVRRRTTSGSSQVPTSPARDGKARARGSGAVERQMVERRAAGCGEAGRATGRRAHHQRQLAGANVACTGRGRGGAGGRSRRVWTQGRWQHVGASRVNRRRRQLGRDQGRYARPSNGPRRSWTLAAKHGCDSTEEGAVLHASAHASRNTPRGLHQVYTRSAPGLRSPTGARPQPITTTSSMAAKRWPCDTRDAVATCRGLAAAGDAQTCAGSDPRMDGAKRVRLGVGTA